MPVAAARFADVGAADPQPAVRGGVGQHRGEELAVGLLDGVPPGQPAARLGDAAGERVTNFLQLTEVEHPRRPRGGDPVRQANAPEAGDDQAAQLALEPPDLPAQLRPRASLLREPRVLCGPLGDKGQPVGLRPRFPVEQIRHGQSLSRLKGRGRDP